LSLSLSLSLPLSLPVHPSLSQAPPPLSLPALISVAPPPWRYLALSQAELGPLFSNSSPFSYSQSLLMVPSPGHTSKPLLRASFGPYSVTEMVSERLPPLSPPLWASLLSEGVELGPGGHGGAGSYKVRVLFQVRGVGWAPGSCLTLHAFRETQEHRASCLTQPPLGVCTVTLTLPSDWFASQHIDQPYLGVHKRQRHAHHRQRAQRHRYGHRVPGPREAPKPPVAPGDRVQLYYSSSGPDQKASPGRCREDRVSQRQLFFFRSVFLRPEGRRLVRNTTREEEACLGGQEGEELHLDSNVLIRYIKGPIRIGQPAAVSVSLKGNLSVTIRLRVKRGLVSMAAKRTLTSDHWAVTLERTHGAKHDVISIVCHSLSLSLSVTSTSLYQQVACLSVEGLKWSFGVAMTVNANWWVEYSGRSTRPPAQGAVLSSFSFTEQPILGIAAITETDTIINTAILSGQSVSLPVTVMAVGRDGTMSDVTAAATCQSSNENIIKVSSDCSSLFVDGSESGVGSTCVGVEFGLGALRSSLCLRVWAPAVPLHVSVSDPVLNAIQGWRHRSQHGCSAVYQRSSVQVLTKFKAHDLEGGITHLMGSSDWMVDVTELVSDSLRVEDPQVAFLGKQNSLIGLEPGKTTLQVVSGQWDGVLGSCDITVTSDPVAPSDLSVQLVSGLGMSITTSPAHPSVVTATVTAFNILYSPDQEASLSVWLQFDDDSSSLLSSFSGLPFSLRLSSLAESVVAVMPGSTQRVVARGDGGGPLLRAELLVPECTEPPLNSNFLSEGERAAPEAGTRSLAGGSGWIRVHLDLDPLQPIGSQYGEGEELELDISDTWVDANADFYSSNQELDTVGSGNQTNADYYGGKILERADVGVGTLLSLVCLSSLLFLVNCLPCSLTERRRRRRSRRRGAGGEGPEEKGEEKGEDERRESCGKVEVKEREAKEVEQLRKEGENMEEVVGESHGER
ncbi:transmembrane protein 132A, partial [Gadus chalcogrammus]|uniref:transmembrane protein 132A n=1 Tax=Gadus chalcogrammus TaxID=1042646 RepID=UPI0024C44824